MVIAVGNVSNGGGLVDGDEGGGNEDALGTS